MTSGVSPCEANSFKVVCTAPHNGELWRRPKAKAPKTTVKKQREGRKVEENFEDNFEENFEENKETTKKRDS